jgi:hypothetical protein
MSVFVAADRLFDVDDGASCSEAGEDVLRTLIDEIPPQVGVHDDR